MAYYSSVVACLMEPNWKLLNFRKHSIQRFHLRSPASQLDYYNMKEFHFNVYRLGYLLDPSSSQQMSFLFLNKTSIDAARMFVNDRSQYADS